MKNSKQTIEWLNKIQNNRWPELAKKEFLDEFVIKTIAEEQVYIGVVDGEFKVFNVATGKSLSQKELLNNEVMATLKGMIHKDAQHFITLAEAYRREFM